MEVSTEKTVCTPCKRKPETRLGNKMGWPALLALAILPKCPLCFVAFSSTLVLCGEAGTMQVNRTHVSDTTIIISAVFCLLTLLAIAFNRRGKRTMYAFTLVATGTAAIMTSVWATGGMSLYYTGVMLLFIGVWLNSSLLFFIRKANAMGRSWIHKTSFPVDTV